MEWGSKCGSAETGVCPEVKKTLARHGLRLAQDTPIVERVPALISEECGPTQISVEISQSFGHWLTVFVQIVLTEVGRPNIPQWQCPNIEPE